MKNLHCPYFIKFILLILLSYSGNIKAQANRLRLASQSSSSTQDLQTLVKPLQAFAQSKNNISETTGNPLAELMRTKPEDLSKRTATTKHFKNADGSYTAIIGAGQMHYQKNGKWEDIETTIKKNISTDYTFSNTTNVMESYFGNTSKKGVKSITKEGEIKEFLNNKMYWESKGEKIGEIEDANVIPDVQGDKLYYRNIFGNIFAEFTIKTGQRKLNYIIPNKKDLGKIPINTDYLVFEEEIRLSDNFSIVNGIKKYNKLKKEYQIIPGIYVIDNNDNVILEYSAPSIVENYNSSIAGLPSQIQPELSFKKNGSIVTLYTKVNANWITNKARIFPIAIDPTANIYPFTTNYSSGQTFSSNGASGNIAVGYNGGWYRGWATFDLTSLPSLSNVTSANMSLYINNKGGQMGTPVGNNTNSINIGHTSYDLSRLVWLNNYTNLYNAITDPANGMGAYNYMPNQNIATWANVTLNPGTVTMALTEIEKKSGNDMAFFPVSFSAGWSTGTTTRFYVLAGYSDVNKPYLTINYSDVDKYMHAAHTNGNAAGYKDVGYIQIGNVTLGSINNTTAITSSSQNSDAKNIYKNTPTGYNRYNLSTNVNPGNTYTLNATYRDLGIPFNSGKIAVWVDWNEDGDFADANEYIGVSANSITGNQVLSFNITVPTGTSAGTKRLRVRSALYDQIISASNYNTTFDYGETEDYDLIVLGDPTLKVTNAGTSASHSDGTYTIANNTSVTVTSGTQTGYNVTGWTGTGSVPTSGSGGTATFNITQNSTIDWQWQQVGLPNNLKFYNYGGNQQLAFNHSRHNSTTPIFRLSHTTDPATDYQIEINTNATFSGGTSWTQSFTGNYPLNTETNFTFNNGFSPSSGTTYYVRARAKGEANIWSSWTTDTYSFTYDTNYTVSNWFQTTQAQFQTNNLVGTQADTNHDVITGTGGNLVTNGDLSSPITTGWTITGANGAGKVVAIYTNPHTPNFSGNWLGIGSGSTIFQSANGTIVVSQLIDLTNVSEISFNAGSYNYVGGFSDPAPNTKAEFKIGGTLTDINGTIEASLTQSTNPTRQDKTINVSTYSGLQIIKFVMTYNANWNGNGVTRFYFGDIKANATPKGTVTSTPITLSSVQNAINYDKIRWNQTLGGGTLKLKLQQTTLGGSTWADIAGYDNIGISGDGEKEFDLSAMTAYPQIRLVGELDGAGVKLHDWAILYPEPCDKTWTGTISTDWTNPSNWAPNGIPTNKHCINIPDVSNKPNIPSNIVAIGKSLELQNNAQLSISSDATLRIIENITNHGNNTNFVLENNASLIQEDTNPNTFSFTYKRNTSAAWAKDYIYLSSPISNAKLNEISNESGKNFSSYYTWQPIGTTSPEGLWASTSATSTMTPGLGYIARIPTSWVANTIYKMNFKGIPNNGNISVNFQGGNATDNPATTDLDESLLDKWNLIGNPYPSAVDAYQLLNNNKNLIIDPANPTAASNGDGALYFWNHKNGTGAVVNPFYNDGVNYTSDPNNHYIVKNFTGSVPITPTATDINGISVGTWNGMIPAGQSFYLRARANINASIVFDNSMRVAGQNDNYYKNNVSNNRFWLDLTRKENSKSAQALIGYLQNATNQLDFLYDGLSMDNELDVYSIVDNHLLIIQGRALPFNIKDIIPIGYKAPASGYYKIGLFKTEGLFAPFGDQKIFLKDKTNNIIHNLIEQPYDFLTSEGRFNDRFEILYEKAVLTTIENNSHNTNIVYDWSQHNWLITNNQSKLSTIEVYDLSGKLIWTKKELNTNSFRLPFSTINQKVALIKILTKDGNITTKKIINP